MISSIGFRPFGNSRSWSSSGSESTGALANCDHTFDVVVVWDIEFVCGGFVIESLHCVGDEFAPRGFQCEILPRRASVERVGTGGFPVVVERRLDHESDELLDTVAPEAVIVSSGYDNRYDHPTRTVLQRLDDQSGQTYWTGTHGDILLVSDGRSVSVRTQRAAPTGALSLRDANPAPVGTTGILAERAVRGDGDVVTPTATPATDGGTPTPASGELSLVEGPMHQSG